MKRNRKKQSGFSLIELLIAMAVLLVLVSFLVYNGAKAMEASRQTSAVQSAQTWQSDELTYQKSYGGFSPLAASLGGAGLTTPANCIQDQEITTTTGTNPLPAAYDSGYTKNGYLYTYKAGGTGFNSSTPGCTAQVFPGFELVGHSADSKTADVCADQTGVYVLPVGTAVVGTGIGCLADNAAATPQ